MRQVFVGLYILSAVNITAQDMFTDSTASLVAYWPEGDVKDFIVKSTMTQYEGVKLVRYDSSSYNVRIHVLEELPSSYTLSWQISFDSDIIEDPYCAIVNALTIKYKTDELGAFDKVINEEEIRSAISAMIGQLRKEFKNHSSDFEEALKQIEQVLSTRDAIELVLLKDIQLFHMAYGFEYLLN